MSNYETLRRMHFSEMIATMPDYVGRTHWSSEQIRAERQDALRQVLRVAMSGSPWYRQKLGNVDPDTFRIEDLGSLPVLTKADLVEHFDDILTDHRVNTEVVEQYLAELTGGDAYLFDEYRATVTGGSSGVRSVLAFDWEAWKKYYLALFRYIYRDPPFIRDGGRAPVVVGIGTTNAAYMSWSLRQTFRQPDQESIGLSVRDPMEHNVARINEINPEVLFGYPSTLRPLVAHALSGDLRTKPVAIISLGEPLMPDLLESIKTAWPNVVVYDWYIAGEGGCIAAGCGKGPGLHLNEDLVILEAVDETGAPVPPGVRSEKVYLTNLANPLMPLIRYEMDDQVTYLPREDECPCGSQHQRIAAVHGRGLETFHYPGGVSVSAVALYLPMLETAVIEFQIRQTPDGVFAAVRLRHDDPENLALLVRKLTDALVRVGLTNPAVEVEQVDEISRLDISGKVARFVPLPSPVED